MPKDNYFNFEKYNEEKPWLEIIRYKKRKKPMTPVERVKRELERSIEFKKKIVKSTEIDELLPKLREMLADEIKGIEIYTKLRELLMRISIATGDLEAEGRIIQGIIADEIKHKKDLEYMIRDLTK